LLRSPKLRRSVGPARQFPGRPTTTSLRFESLEDRSLPSGTVTITASDDSPLGGERVTWTAVAVDGGATSVYQFSAAPHGGAFHVLRVFSRANGLASEP